MSEAGNKSCAYSVGSYGHYYGDSRRGGLGGLGSWCRKCHKNLDVEMNQPTGQIGKPVIIAVTKTVLDDQVFSFDIPEIAKSLPDRVNVGGGSRGRGQARIPIRAIFVCCC